MLNLQISRAKTGLACAVITVLALSGCIKSRPTSRMKRPATRHTVYIDWNAENDLSENEPTMEVSGRPARGGYSGEYRKSTAVWVSETIDGQHYGGPLVYYNDSIPEGMTAADEIHAHVLENGGYAVRVLARRESEPEPAIEIRVLCKETFTLGLISFVGVIVDTESGKDLGAPAIVPPGQHVLRAKLE